MTKTELRRQRDELREAAKAVMPRTLPLGDTKWEKLRIAISLAREPSR